jgi:DNA polymerase-1
MKKFFILDGNALLHRAWHAIPPLATSDGTVVNAVYGFANVIEKFREQYKPDYFVVAWDLPGGTFRHEVFEDYKATRKQKEPELYAQIPMIQELLAAYGIKSISKQGLEADDLIGIAANSFADAELQVVIVTGDYDSLQLVNENVRVLAFVKGVSQTKLFGRNEVHEKFGVWPEQMIDYKALAGDTSDNIPGFKGIGAKTAINLLAEYGSIDGIFKALKEGVLPEKFHKYFAGQEEYAKKMRFLVTILTENGLDLKIEDYLQEGQDNAKLLVLFERYEFRTLIAKYQQVLAKEQYLEPVPEIQHTKNEQGLVIAWFFEDEFVIYKNGLLSNEKPQIVFDLKNLMHEGFVFDEDVFDVMIAAYVVASHLRAFTFEGILKYFRNEKIATDASGQYWQIARLYNDLQEKLKEGDLQKVYKEIEQPLVKVLYRMETNGIAVNREVLQELQKSTQVMIDDLTTRIHNIAGRQFNINSPSQLAEILFVDLGISTAKIKKTKSGFSTAASELEKMWDLHEIIPLISEYRELAKLQSTYIESLPKLIADEGRLHTTYNQTGTSTGRLSSTDPNLQNIPIRSELGMKIRQSFVADEGYLLLACDYSQIELRIVTEISQDDSFMKAFSDGADIHTRTAALMLGKNEDEVSKDERRAAKAINFGILYGMGARALARSAGIEQKVAKTYIDKYFEIHPGIAKYMENMKNMAHDKGFVETMYGRRRYLPEINSRLPMMVAQAERMAINFPAQGSQADLLKLAMINIHNRSQEMNYQARMLLQVHDELVFEVREDVVNEFAEFVRKEMLKVWKGKIKLQVNLSAGKNWGELKEI